MLAAVLLLLAGCAADSQIVLTAYKFETIKLPPPNLEKGIPLMQALAGRKTTREISDRKIPAQELSEILWAANGVNRPKDGKRTSPAAVNKQAVDIYVVLEEGIFLFDAVKNELEPIAKGDFRKSAGMQDFVFIAPLNIVYVFNPAKFNEMPQFASKMSDEDKKIMAAIAAGCMAQNVGLYCASEKLGSTVRAMVDREKLGGVMKLRPEQSIIFAQTVGYPK
jgi:nitroreductase